MTIVKNFWRALTGRRYLVGRDLQGNEYFEYPHTAGSGDFGRQKRQVKYLKESNAWPGFASLPIQWHSWLSHTRPNPPTLDELQADLMRQQRVKAKALMIEERDREERNRQQIEPPLQETFSSPAETHKPATPAAAAAPPLPQWPSKTFAPGSDEPESWTPRTTVSRGG